MGLADAAREKKVGSATCWAQTLSPELRRDLDEVEAMQEAGEEIHKAAVWRELRRQGVDVGDSAVLRHFRYECKCR